MRKKVLFVSLDGLISNVYYRKDVGDRWFEDSDRLHIWGYLRE
jgi:phosphoribosylamine---glycine ligase